MGRYNDSGVIETVQCYWCGKTVGCNIAQKFDGKRFCTLRHRENWAKELVRQGATHRKPRKSKTKAPKPTPKTKKKKLWFR